MAGCEAKGRWPPGRVCARASIPEIRRLDPPPRRIGRKQLPCPLCSPSLLRHYKGRGSGELPLPQCHARSARIFTSGASPSVNSTPAASRAVRTAASRSARRVVIRAGGMRPVCSNTLTKLGGVPLRRPSLARDQPSEALAARTCSGVRHWLVIRLGGLLLNRQTQFHQPAYRLWPRRQI